MELTGFLERATALKGVPGYEKDVAEYVAEEFSKICDDVIVDKMYNVIARMGKAGPRVIVCAHTDEIGLMITAVEDDGSLRFRNMGGVDPRILPSAEVRVHTKSGEIYGVIGAVPPHLSTPEERSKPYIMDDLYIDIGKAADEVKALVRPGDVVTLIGRVQPLLGNNISGKTLDDRAGVAVMLKAAQRLAQREIKAQVFFVATCQEEVGVKGATMAAYSVEPDIGIAIDVTHAKTPGTAPDEAYALNKVVTTIGPNIHKKLHEGLMETAKRERVGVNISVCPRPTGTDARALQISRDGVPSVLIEVPLRYMHTTVEIIDAEVVNESARLIAEFIAGLNADWEELLCYC